MAERLLSMQGGGGGGDGGGGGERPVWPSKHTLSAFSSVVCNYNEY